MSNKIPDMPDFLKKDEDKVNPPKVTPPPPPLPNMGTQISPDSELRVPEPKQKRRFIFGKQKGKIPLIEFRNDQGDMVPSSATKDVPKATINDYFPPIVGQILVVLLLAAVGTGLFFYYQAEAYKNRFQAMDTRVLSFTKEIASLNQENNSLSGKIVNYQKELESKSDIKVEELQKQVTDLQSQLAGKPAVATSTTSPVNATAVIKSVEAADPVPAPQQAIAPTAVSNSPVTTKPTPTVQLQKTMKATDPSVNYEPRLKSKGELSCLQYYKTENLKKCQGRDAKYTAVMVGSKNTPSGVKLTYQCQGSGTKPLNFKYGPMEIYNNCAGR